MEAIRNGMAPKGRARPSGGGARGGLAHAHDALAPGKAHAAQGATLTVGSRIEYDAYNTTWFEVDGQPAWCGNPSKNTPAAGTYAKSALAAVSGRTDELAADIWFSYGSPGFDASLWPSTWYGGGSMTPEPLHGSCPYPDSGHLCLRRQLRDYSDAPKGSGSGFVKRHRFRGSDGQLINDDATGRKIAARAGEVPSTFEPFMLYTGSTTQVILSFTYHTTVKVAKSASESWASSDSDYSLAGAVYGVYGSTRTPKPTATA